MVSKDITLNIYVQNSLNPCDTLCSKVMAVEEASQQREKILVYPNPFKHQANFMVPGYLQGGHLLVFDHLGKLVAELPNCEKNQAFKRQDLKSGFYVFVIINDKHVETGKIFIVD